jgi:signal transduction histidine kinase
MPRHWHVWYWGVTLTLGCALSLLAWRIVEQDRSLVAQRMSDTREAAADRVVAALERRLVEVEQRMVGDPCPVKGVCVSLASGVLKAWPKAQLLYRPDVIAEPEVHAQVLSDADAAEFVAQDSRKAIGLLSGSLRSSDRRMRAAVLARIARNLRKLGRDADAMVRYRDLIELGEVQVGGMPAALAGRVGMMNLDRVHAAALRDELLAGGWAISYGTFAALRQDVENRLGPVPFRTALAEAVQRIWVEGLAGNQGRMQMEVETGQVLAVWRRGGNDLSVYLSEGDDQWLDAIGGVTSQAGVKVTFGKTPGPAAVRMASNTGLPWTIQVTNRSDGDTSWKRRAYLIGVGLALVLGLVMVAGWVMGRAVERQAALARQQSDFVSAVSHEFRTPLTALKQLTELLMHGRVAGDTDRNEYYRLLHAESGRLQMVVEGLLNFGRLEAGKAQFRFDGVDAAAFVCQCVEEFQAQAGGFRFEVSGHAGDVRADREALKIALWNLLENAVKYSPERKRAWVAVAREERSVAIAVRDEGIGIPKNEQVRVFEKFVRGAEARERGVRGTGVGLATVRQIMDAHGGRIDLESDPGAGSTFTLRLPMWEG